MRVKLNYRFDLEFSNEVKDHRFALKITPRKTPFYRVEEFVISLQNNIYINNIIDGFGKVITFGTINNYHKSFSVEISAKIDFFSEYLDFQDDFLNEMYLSATNLTTSNIYINEYLNFKNELKIYNNIEKNVLLANEYIFQNFKYESGVTDAYSSIDTILQSKRGVCQDFAHLLIAYLRDLKIPARYVSGFVTGEGESHAWVEYFNGKIWLGVDPTHNRIIKNEPYIKIAQGRDALDTAINKGSFVGKSKQQLKVFAQMEIYN